MSCYGEQKTNVVAWAIAHKKVTSKRVANKACGMADFAAQSDQKQSLEGSRTGLFDRKNGYTTTRSANWKRNHLLDSRIEVDPEIVAAEFEFSTFSHFDLRE